MTKTEAGFCENPDSTDNLVRDLEESGYPVDGAKEQFAPQPDSLTAESDRSGSPPAQPDGPRKQYPLPQPKKKHKRGDVDEQGHRQTLPERTDHSRCRRIVVP